MALQRLFTTLNISAASQPLPLVCFKPTLASEGRSARLDNNNLQCDEQRQRAKDLATKLQDCKATYETFLKRRENAKKKKDEKNEKGDKDDTTRPPPGAPSRGMQLVGNPGGEKALLTVYSWQSNTPCNSVSRSAYWRPDIQLIPFVSVAVPSRLLAQEDLRSGRTSGVADQSQALRFGQVLMVEHLRGRTMPSGERHSGLVVVSDVCGDDHVQEYCFSSNNELKLDLFVGDWTASNTNGCEGPWGSGLDPTVVRKATPDEATRVRSINYGGRAQGTERCGDCDAARRQMSQCWYYTPPASSAQWCP